MLVKAMVWDQQGMQENVVLDVKDPKWLAPTTAPVQSPPTAELVEQHQTRLPKEKLILCNVKINNF